jgi:predicted lipoprotein with Yx(FWY)xxD motif
MVGEVEMRLAILVILGLGLAACAAPPPPPPGPPPGPPPQAGPPPGPPPAPMARRLGPALVERTAIGPVLADRRGLTLYTFDHDKRGVSACYGKCATAWPPFRAGPGARPGGPWRIVVRRGGERQWAYKGRLLYTWFKDHAPGQTSGDGLHGVWHVARP